MIRIKGRYQGRTETLDTADNQAEAERLRREYAQAYGPTWAVWVEDPPERRAWKGEP